MSKWGNFQEENKTECLARKLYKDSSVDVQRAIKKLGDDTLSTVIIDSTITRVVNQARGEAYTLVYSDEKKKANC